MAVGKFLSNLEPPGLMGIINVTPDSFYDGGEYNRVEAAVNRARNLVAEGADLLDVGGVSSRPGAPEVSPAEERRRVAPVVRALREAGITCPISVDTFRASIAEATLEAGADWINDITALRADPELAEIIAEREVPLVLMHMQGTPQDMQDNPSYSDVITEVCNFFEKQIKFARSRGISENQLLLDPGIGFGKTLRHNGRILRELDKFNRFNLPLLIGHSRKSYLEDLLDREVEGRLPGTLATSAHLFYKNVDIIRVHDMAAHFDLRRVLSWLRKNG